MKHSQKSDQRQFDSSKTVASDFDGDIPKTKKTNRSEDEKKSGWRQHKNGLFKDESEIEAIATFGANKGPERSIDGKSAQILGRIHFEIASEVAKRRNKRAKGEVSVCYLFGEYPGRK
jgi:hypothetical protein